MSISRELFLSILAMDAYNRGYDAAVKVSGNQLGLATLTKDSETLLGEDGKQRDKPIGFYASAYAWSDQTVISYRGTDVKDIDIPNGYGVGAGFPGGPQATMAIEFYRAFVSEGQDPRQANIAVTGHSLGAGLAGYVAALYNKANTIIFDNMPFELAAQRAYDQHVGVERFSETQQSVARRQPH